MLDQKRLQELDDMCHLQDKVVSSFEVSPPVCACSQQRPLDAQVTVSRPGAPA